MESEENYEKIDKGLLSKITKQCSTGLTTGLAVGMVGGAIDPSIPKIGMLAPFVNLLADDIFPIKESMPFWTAYMLGLGTGLVINHADKINQFAYQYLDNL